MAPPARSCETLIGMNTDLHTTNAASARRTRPRDRKLTILRAASDAFTRDGYHRTSMTDIARSLDISSTAIYRHFRNKEDLLSQTLLHGLDATVARLQEARHSQDSGNAILTELVTMSLEYRGLPRLWQREVRSLSPAHRQAVLMRVMRLNVALRQVVRTLRPELGPADVEFAAWCVLSIAVSPSHHNVQLPQAAYAEQLGGMIENVVASAPAPAGANQRYDARTVDPESDDEALDRAIRPERLIVAAAHLFNTRGYAAVGIEDIGAAAGISGPSIYHHFGSKSDLLTEIVERNEQWIRLYTSRAMMMGSSTEESLELILRSYAQFAAEQPDLVGTAVTEVIHLPPEYAARFRKTHRDGIVRWARLLQVARPELELDVARVQVQAVTTIVNDAVRNERLRHRPDLVDALVSVGNQVMSAPTTVAHTSRTAG